MHNATEKGRLLTIERQTAEGELISKVEADMQKAANILFIEQAFKSKMIAESSRLIQLINGDPKRVPEYLDQINKILIDVFASIPKQSFKLELSDIR